MGDSSWAGIVDQTAVPRYPRYVNLCKRWLALLSVLVLLVGCGERPPERPLSTPASPSATPPPASPTAKAPVETPTAVSPQTQSQTLTILYTNDEHGWMEGITPEQSAAHLMGVWRAEHGYQPDGPFLLLSGGDMWTGPAISTWFNGEGMVEVMNSMGYSAAAVGNHEFDFGLDALRQRAAEANFPFLSANIRRLSDGAVPTDLGIRPYALHTVENVTIGLVGLTTRLTPTTTNPTNIVEFEFIDYEAALRDVVPEVRAAGADLIFVPGHICRDELFALATAVSDLDIQLFGGGHCNELFADTQAEAVLLSGGSSLSAYAFATFEIANSGEISLTDYGTRANLGGAPDPVVQTAVFKWQATTRDELNVVIGHTERGLERRSPAMQQLLTESWLLAYPADVAISNLGGFRAPLPAGEITLADIVTVLPFDNAIIDVTVTGDQLLRLLGIAYNEAIGGVRLEGAEWVLNRTNEPIDPAATYQLLVNNFMYAGGDGYELLAEFDPDAYDTGIDWRQPVIDWLIDQPSSPDAPLDDAIDQLGHGSRD